MFYIITICFNDLEGLKETYKSIKSQIFIDYKWIVIDGDSKDGSKEWLDSLKMYNFHYISEKDNGIYDAMNKGLELISDRYSGLYIFMNSGDKFSDSKVLDYVNSKYDKDTGFIYGNYIDVLKEKSVIEYYKKNAKNVNYIKYGMITSHQAIFFSVSIFVKFRYNTNLLLSSDYDYICRVILFCKKNKINMLYLNRYLCKFLLGGCSLSNRSLAIKEDYYIRRETLKCNIVLSVILYVLHYFHFFLKKYIPKYFNSRRIFS